MIFFPVTPVSKPKQSKRDRWAPSVSVQKFRAFRDEMRVRGVQGHVTTGNLGVVFFMPLPKRTSRRRRRALHGTPHQLRPDVDNMLKALFDICWPEEDAAAWDVRAAKVWTADAVGGVLLYQLEPVPSGLLDGPFDLEELIDGHA